MQGDHSSFCFVFSFLARKCKLSGLMMSLSGLRESEVGELHHIYTHWTDKKTNTLSLNILMDKLHAKVTPFTRKGQGNSCILKYHPSSISKVERQIIDCVY